MENDCIFCKIAAKKLDAKLVYEDNDTVAFEDINPQAPVHVIIIPRKHVERVSDLDSKDAGIPSQLVTAANRIAEKKDLKGPGYRLIINCNKDAGQAVFHLHMHLLGGRKMLWPPG
jgi:histidine triad (HIT) family protein